MRIPMPFPQCPKCRQSWKQSTHTDCGGLLEIDPHKHEVYCTKCGKHWDLWDSKYHCACKHTFFPEDVNGAIKAMLEVCEIAIDELEKREIAIKDRSDLYKVSFREFLVSFMDKLGYWAGLAIETILRILKK